MSETPEQLAPRARRATKAPKARSPIAFRLDDQQHTALIAIAKRAKVGRSTMVRLIVEAYLREHSDAR